MILLFSASLCTGELLSNETYPVRFATTKARREDAFKLCVDAGQKLVKIDSREKMDFILSVINQCSSKILLSFDIRILTHNKLTKKESVKEELWIFMAQC